MQGKITALEAAMILTVLFLCAFVVLAMDFDDKCRSDGGRVVGFFECEGRRR